jgi:hypothetical protein
MTTVVEWHQPPAPLVKTLNVVLRRVLPSPLGRRTGQRYRFPVTAHRDAEGLYALTPAGWKANFRGGADVDVTLAGRTTPMRGVLIEDETVVARTYLDRITELGLRRAGREIGLRFPAGRLPTLAEVTELARREHFGVVRLSGKP